VGVGDRDQHCAFASLRQRRDELPVHFDIVAEHVRTLSVHLGQDARGHYDYVRPRRVVDATRAHRASREMGAAMRHVEGFYSGLALVPIEEDELDARAADEERIGDRRSYGAASDDGDLAALR